MNILIGADLVPTKHNISLFESGDVAELVGSELTECLNCADYRIFNLEIPLTEYETPISKCGPNLIAPSKCITGYKALHVDLLTLANNHILDQGHQGLESTVQVLDRAGIAYTGVGNTQEEAAKPHVFECDGKKIGVYACAEREFSIVTEHSAGANPIDWLESPDHVARLKEQCDYVIVLYHGGKEHYRYPSPNLQKVCRKLVDKGADLVLCQHSHCIGCEEKYNGGTIVYGQGNFLFDCSESEFWQTSLLVKIGPNFSIGYIPLKKVGNTVRVAKDAEAEKILGAFRQRSLEIQKPDAIQDRYAQFSREYLDTYQLTISGFGRRLLFRIVNRLSGYRFSRWFMDRWYRRRDLLAIQNFVECEAHRELMIEALKYVNTSISGEFV